MDCTVSKTDLLKLVNRAVSIAESKSTMPILSNVLLTAQDGKLKIDATDLYLAISGSSDTVEVKAPGAVAVSAKDLFERCRLMPAGPIRLTSKDGASLVMKAGGSARKYSLRGMPGSEFPPMPFPAEGSPTLAIDVAVLQQLISNTIFSVSTDESRAHLNAALFEWEKDTVRMVSTDGHRLSKIEVKIEGRQASAKMLIQLKALQELRRMCDEKEDKAGQLNIIQSGNSAFFQGSGGFTFSVKLVDAVFPSYEQVIPKNSTKTVKVPRAAFADALRAVSVAASEKTGAVKLTLDKNSLKISSESPESGDGEDEILSDYSGAPFSIGFNAKYFLDALGALDEEEITLGLGDDLAPCVIKPVGSRQYLGVVMPMRI